MDANEDGAAVFDDMAAKEFEAGGGGAVVVDPEDKAPKGFDVVIPLDPDAKTEDPNAKAG